MRVLPDGGHAHERPGHGERAPLGHRARGEERGGALHRQGGVPHQRDGHLQGPDGEGCDSQGARARGGRGDDHLLYPLRQRHGQPRQCHTPVGGADDRGAAHNRNGPRHDALHDDPRRRRGPGGVRLRARPQRRPVRAEGTRGHTGHPRQGVEGDLRRG